MAQRSLLFIGVGGVALALDRATGEEVWRCELKGSDFVNVVQDGKDLLATAKGELFCLDAATGKIRWKNQLKGMGRGLISIATADGQQTVLAQEQRRREQEAAASAAASA
jgi:outer membrane protein assembly factor BamB